MKMAPMPLMWWRPTAVSLGFLLSETTQELALEMAVALLVPIVELIQHVNVSETKI